MTRVRESTGRRTRRRGTTRAHLGVLVGVLALVLTLVLAGQLVGVANARAATPWQVTWASPMDLAIGTTYNSTVRDVATVAVAGSALELTFSNLWSATPTTFAAVTVGVEQSGPTVVPGTFVPVTFANGQRTVVVAAHAQVTSDPVALAVRANEKISVSIAVAGWATVSVHFCCQGNIDSWATSNGVGDHTLDPSATSFNPLLTGPDVRWLTGVAVANSPAQGAVVAFGDSITDGYGYENNGFSWVNALQDRIDALPSSDQMSVINEGIAGNTLTVFPPYKTFEYTSGGLPGVTRLGTDALGWPGVKDVVVLLGTNDIWFGAGGLAGHPIPPFGTAASIEAGLETIAQQVRARGLRAYAITLLPRATTSKADHDLPEYWGPQEQAVLSAVNAWLLGAKTAFSGVINLAAVMSDVYNGACAPATPFAPYFNPDHLHPNQAGDTVMANAISTTLFGLPQAPRDAPLVVATPTPGCAGAQVAAHVLASTTVTTTTTTTTTTIPPTTTTTAPSLLHRVGSRGATLLVALVLVGLALALLVRRRAIRRRRARQRRALQRRLYPPPPPPTRSPPPPPRPRPPRPRPPRR